MRNLDYTSGLVVHAEKPAALLQLSEAETTAPLQNTRMHGGVYKSLAAILFAIMGAFFWTFWQSAEAIFMVAISTFYFVMYLGTPLVSLWVADEKLGDGSDWSDFLNQPFATHTGTLSGREVWLQVITIPVALLVGVVAISVAITLFP